MLALANRAKSAYRGIERCYKQTEYLVLCTFHSLTAPRRAVRKIQLYSYIYATPSVPVLSAAAGIPTVSLSNSVAPAAGSNATVPSAKPSALQSGAAPGTHTILASAASATPSKVPSPGVAPASVPSAAPSAVPAANPDAGSSSSNTSCTGSQVVCSQDGSMFGLCNQGSALMKPVAAGTKCANGAIGHAKRSAKFAKSFNA